MRFRFHLFIYLLVVPFRLPPEDPIKGETDCRDCAHPLQMSSVAYGGLSLSVTLSCRSEGEPPANFVTWRKNGKVVTINENSRVSVTKDGSLHIRSMLNYDEGRYTCTPYNILGTTGESDEIRLIAKSPPIFTRRPQTELEAEIGKPLTVYCNGKGDPNPTFGWKKVGSELVTNPRISWKGGNLTITSVKKHDHGRWQCVMTNPVTKMTSDIQINVKYTTPHAITNVTIVMSYNSASIRWFPGYDGGYPQHFMIWYKRADEGDHMWSTKYVNGSLKRATVSRLQHETIYQFAVLAENVLGSGKFSKTVTARTQAAPTKAPVHERERVPEPYDLRFCANKQGLFVISWKTSPLLDDVDLLGFLIEYRISANTQNSKDGNPTNCDFSVAKKRQISTTKNKRSVGFENDDETSVALVEMPENNLYPWKKLAAYPSNTSKVEIDREKLVQDELYEIHVLAVTPSAYSSPSDPILVNTRGMTAYTVAVPSAVSAAVLSGIIAGVLFVVITFITAIKFCLCRRKYQEERSNSTAILNSSMPLAKLDQDAMKSSTSSHSSDINSQTASCSKFTNNENAGTKKKKGVFKKIKSKFEKKKRRADSNKQNLIRAGFFNGPKQANKSRRFAKIKFIAAKKKRNNKTVKNLKGSPVKKLGPIYRSPDGKFHLSDPNSSCKISSSATRSKSISNDQNREAFCTEKDRNKIQSRPVSDSILVDDNMGWTRRPNEIAEDIDGPSLEIDCSQSDIEVRIVANEQNSSLVPPSLVSPQIYDLPAPNDQSSKHAMTSYITDPIIHPRMSIAQSKQFVGPISSFAPTAEYIYLQDIGIPCADTPLSDAVCSPRSFSPMINLNSPQNFTPAQYPRYKYHSHVLVPGGHYHLSPRNSFASPSPRTWMGPATSSMQPEHFQYRSLHPRAFRNQIVEATNMQFHSEVSSNQAKFERRNLQNVEGMYRQNSSLDRMCSITSASPTLPAIPREATIYLTENNVSNNSNNNAVPSPRNLSRSLRSHSSSLPSLPCRKTSGPNEKQRNTSNKGKRSASTDDVVIRSDTESERGFSFASGSASTVRYIASRESSSTLIGDENIVGSSHHVQSSVRLNPSHHFEKTLSISPSVLPSETGAGSCSGYESQNTSSDMSSHCLTSRALSNNGDHIRHQRLQSNYYHPHTNRNREFSNRQLTDNHVMNGQHPTSRTRASTTSSDESRSRKDNSSVDEKYEFDSEFAMESEILEALKYLENHSSRENPVSYNLLQELRTWQANKQDAAEALRFSTSNVYHETDCGNEETSLLSSPSDSSYSSEKIQQRCALLRKEYLEYKRWLNSQMLNVSSPVNEC